MLPFTFFPPSSHAMKTEENLNTESNSIAGNPVGGPAGNTAARPLPVSTSANSSGSPTQLPTPASQGRSASPGAKAGTSSQALAASEMSVGQGAVGGSSEQQANKAVPPTALKEPAKRGRKPGSVNKAKATPQGSTDAKPRGGQPRKDPATGRQPETYGGNFGNDVQGSYQDHDRRDNQDSDASRGEFGSQGRAATHGGYGNQNREFDYERHNTPEDRYYGGPGRYGHQHNAYRDYDGRNERWDERSRYGFERGFHPADGYDRRESHDRPGGNFGNGYDNYQGRPAPDGSYNDGRGNRYDNRNQPERGDYNSGRQNDNGSRQGRGGYADDYGRTSVGGDPYGNRPRYDDYDRRGPEWGGPRRNQDEDYRSSRGGYDNQGSGGGRGSRREDDYGYRDQGYDQRGQRPDYSRGYGDRGRDEARHHPSYRTDDDRNGYGRSYDGDIDQGYGSRGGSYNDSYEDSRPGSRSGAPGRGDYRREDADRNYGPGPRSEFRRDDDPDYGSAPRRNRGREGEGDE
jgi:hypothetical protein